MEKTIKCTYLSTAFLNRIQERTLVQFKYLRQIIQVYDILRAFAEYQFASISIV